MIRPERIGVEAHGTAGDNRVPGLVERSVFLGNSFELHVRIVGGDVLKAMVAERRLRDRSSRRAPRSRSTCRPRRCACSRRSSRSASTAGRGAGSRPSD